MTSIPPTPAHRDADPDADTTGPAVSPSDALLASRYGRGRERSRRDRRVLIGVLSVVAAAGLGWGVWTALAGSVGGVHAEDLGYQIVDDTTVQVRYAVTAPLGSTVRCSLEALSESKATLGWKVIELPPSEEPTRTVTDTLRTVFRPATGLVSGCWVA